MSVRNPTAGELKLKRQPLPRQELVERWVAGGIGGWGLLLLTPGQKSRELKVCVVVEVTSVRTKCWDVRVGGGLRGGLEPWRWLPDVTGLSGNRLGAELPVAAAKAAAAAAAARLGLRPFTLRFLQPPLQPRGGGFLPTASRWLQVRDKRQSKASDGPATRWLGGSGANSTTPPPPTPRPAPGTPVPSFGPHAYPSLCPGRCPGPWPQLGLVRRLAAPQCNSLQPPLGSCIEAVLHAAGPLTMVHRRSLGASGLGV